MDSLCDFSTVIEEGGTLRTDIRFQFRNNQNPFSVHLCPVNISTVEDLGLGFVIDSGDIDINSRATAGEHKYNIQV